MSQIGFKLLESFHNQDKIMTFQFERILESLKQKESSSVTFGSLPKHYLDNYKINYYSVEQIKVRKNFNRSLLTKWRIQLDDILIGGKSKGLCPNGCLAIVDTGSSFGAGPTDDLDVLLASLNIASDCSNFRRLPDIE